MKLVEMYESIPSQPARFRLGLKDKLPGELTGKKNGGRFEVIFNGLLYGKRGLDGIRCK